MVNGKLGCVQAIVGSGVGRIGNAVCGTKLFDDNQLTSWVVENMRLPSADLLDSRELNHASKEILQL
jgi:hypothetical protein